MPYGSSSAKLLKKKEVGTADRSMKLKCRRKRLDLSFYSIIRRVYQWYEKEKHSFKSRLIESIFFRFRQFLFVIIYQNPAILHYSSRIVSKLLGITCNPHRKSDQTSQGHKSDRKRWKDRV